MLRTIGRYGATEAELGPLATGSEIAGLIASGYVTHEPIDASGLPDAWYLTDSGAKAIGVDSGRLRNA